MSAMQDVTATAQAGETAYENSKGQGVSHATNSNVPESIQRKAPASVEDKIPDSVNDSECSPAYSSFQGGR